MEVRESVMAEGRRCAGTTARPCLALAAVGAHGVYVPDGAAPDIGLVFSGDEVEGAVPIAHDLSVL